MMSSRYTQKIYTSDWSAKNELFISCREVLDALHRPKGIQLNMKSLDAVHNAVLAVSFSDGTWLSPVDKSSVGKPLCNTQLIQSFHNPAYIVTHLHCCHLQFDHGS